MNRVVILQPSYLPWLGFFDLMYKADSFVIFDDVQYTKRDWRSRNRIKTAQGPMWLTVPVKAKGTREKCIKDIEIDDSQNWQKKHLGSFRSFYQKSEYFTEVMSLITAIYEKQYKLLIDLDMDFILKVHDFCSINTKVLFSSDIISEGSKDEKLLSICKYLNATHYLSGNAAQGYLRESIFKAEGISVEWHNYKHPYYNQLWLKGFGFISHLSVIDLLLNHGADSFAILTNKKVIGRPKEVKLIHADDFSPM